MADKQRYMLYGDGSTGQPLGYIYGNSLKSGSVGLTNEDLREYTIEMWFRADNLAKEAILFSQTYANSYKEETFIGIRPAADGKGADLYAINGQGHQVVSDSPLLKEGGWYHLALVHRKIGANEGEFVLYLYGHEVGRARTSGFHRFLSSPTYVGRDYNNNNKNLAGAIDEIRIWLTVARTEADIQANFDKIYDKAPSPLAVIFTFDEDNAGARSGTTIYALDTTGFYVQPQHNSTPVRASNNTRQDLFYFNTGTGQKRALDFPGAQLTYVSIPPDDSLNSFEEITVDAWVHPSTDLKTLPAGQRKAYVTVLHKENAFWMGFEVTDRYAKLAYQVITDHADDASKKIYVGADVSFGEWSHVAFAAYKDSYGDISYVSYVNGNRNQDRDYVDDENALDPTAKSLHLGSSENTNNGYLPFKGQMTEVRIWERNLDKEETLADGSKKTVLSIDGYRLKELPDTRPLDSTLQGDNVLLADLSCDSTDLVAYYKFDHGVPGADNTGDDQHPGVNWLRDYSQKGNHGILKGFALNGDTSNWVEATIIDEGSGQAFDTVESNQNPGVVPEAGLLLKDPKLYEVQTDPDQPDQESDKQFDEKTFQHFSSWDEIAGLYLLVNAKKGDVLVLTLNARRLRNTTDNAGVAVGIAVNDQINERNGIFYERGTADADKERGGLNLQYVYRVEQSGLQEVRAAFAAYGGGGGKAVLEAGGSSTLHVMAYKVEN